MSEENVETVRAVFALAAKGDFSHWLDEVTDDYVFVTSRDLPDAGTYRGEEAKEWVTSWVESFEGHTIEAMDFAEVDDRVVFKIGQRGRPRGSDAAVEGQ